MEALFDHYYWHLGTKKAGLAKEQQSFYINTWSSLVSSAEVPHLTGSHLNFIFYRLWQRDSVYCFVDPAWVQRQIGKFDGKMRALHQAPNTV